MSKLRLLPRESAERDVRDAVRYYAETGGLDLAMTFIAALEQCYDFIREWPAAGSPRYAHELDLPGLRTRRVAGFPYVVFYFVEDDAIDVWRVLHGQRDVPQTMQSEES